MEVERVKNIRLFTLGTLCLENKTDIVEGHGLEEDSKHRQLNSSISGMKRNLRMGKGKEERKEAGDRAGHSRTLESTQEDGCGGFPWKGDPRIFKKT